MALTVPWGTTQPPSPFYAHAHPAVPPLSLPGALGLMGPSLGSDASFLEEPVMLLAFVLLGRALEARAKVQAAADLQSLARLIPATARLVLDPGAAPGAAAAAGAGPAVEYASVPTTSVRRGDVLRVLPGGAGVWAGKRVQRKAVRGATRRGRGLCVPSPSP